MHEDPKNIWAFGLNTIEFKTMSALFAAKRVVFNVKSIDYKLMSISSMYSLIDFTPEAIQSKPNPIDTRISSNGLRIETSVFVLLKRDSVRDVL